MDLVPDDDVRSFLERLAADPRVSLERGDLDRLVAEPAVFVGRAGEQVAAFVTMVDDIARRLPDGAEYRPGEIL